MKLNSTTSMLLLAGGVIAILLGAAVWQNVGPSKYDDFAQCLADNGAFAYVASWCPVCTQQEELFGSAWRTVPHKECSATGQGGELNLCQDENVTATPSWRLPDGTIDPGLRTLADLATTYGCELPE